MKPEERLVQRVANYLRVSYPDVIFRFDQIDQVGLQGGRKNKALHGKWSRGHPDLIIFARTKKYGAMLLELKATNTVPNTQHTREQEAYHEMLKLSGYKASFACGYDDAIRQINKYMLKLKL